MRNRVFYAHHDDGSLCHHVEVRIYDTLAAMRRAAYRGSNVRLGKKTLGVTQVCVNGGVIIRLSTEALGLREIVHECSHAALELRGPGNITEWTDEIYCHIHDEIFCDIVNWIIEEINDGAMPIDMAPGLTEES